MYDGGCTQGALGSHQRNMVSNFGGGSRFDTFVLADQPSRLSGPRS